MIRNVLNTFRSALAVGAGVPFLLAASAYAQAPAPEATAERVIVTGSYIPTAETESALPVTVYTAEVLQKAGSNTPVEGLRQLPQWRPEQHVRLPDPQLLRLGEEQRRCPQVLQERADVEP